MFKNIKIKNIVIIIAVIVVICVAYYYFRKKKPMAVNTAESSFEKINPVTVNETESVETPVPGFFNLKYKISTQGKKSVFPMMLEKITPGPIELPNRRSLLNKDASYKFKDIMPGDKIKAVSIQNLTYTVDHNVFNDDFLVTDNDYLIAFTQAKEHFKEVV